MAKPQDDRQKDLLRPALKDIVDLGHPLVRLAREIDWGFLDKRGVHGRSGPAGDADAAVAGLFILKHMHDLADEVLCAHAGWRTRITSSSAAN
jgi:transposase, IS5 family